MDIGLVAAIAGAAGLVFAMILFISMKSQPAGTEKMIEIADAIHDGAMAFLKREYSILAIFVIVVAGLLGWGIGLSTMYAFIAGAVCSILAGLSGMQSATYANVRTTEAARSKGEGAALLISFNDVSRAVRKVRSTTETSAVGTRNAIPVIFPASSGMQRPTAFAAPVEAGMMFA